jgi:Protein of unknown function (DUF3036).
MFKIKKSASLAISQVFAWVILLGVLGTCVLLPFVRGWFRVESEDYRTIVCVILYCALAVALIADILLHRLLRNVRREAIFTDSSVKLLRSLSWCCIAECVIFGVLALYLWLGLVISFACAFMGIMLRVVKNVIEEAADIKNENDFTI